MCMPPRSQVLLNRDLLDIIFGFFESNPRRELLWASLTCKAFLESGLDALWKDVRNIFQLCCLLPAYNKTYFRFNAVVLDQDIERVLYYTRRIRSLFIDMEKTETMPTRGSDVLCKFFQRINKAAAFYSLHTLRISGNWLTMNNHQKLYPFPISAPNLEALDLSGHSQRGISEPTFLCTTSSESKNLKSLKIRYPFPWSKTMCDAVFSFQKVQHLCIEYISCTTPMSFLKDCASSMTSLRSLMIHLDYFRFTDDAGNPVSVATLRTLGLITFGLLSDLKVVGPFCDIGNMLNLLSVPSLATLSLHDTSLDQITEISPFIQGFLMSNGEHLKGGLQSLALYGDSTAINIGGYLDPFKGCTKLESLHVESANIFPFSPFALANFLANIVWKDLTELYLDGGRSGYSEPSDVLSMVALPLLANALPKLRHLTIAICNPGEDITIPIIPHGLETLKFLFPGPRTWVPSAVPFASFLHRLFPKLKKVECDDHKKWLSAVCEMLTKKQSRN